jgi:hypothetical protein
LKALQRRRKERASSKLEVMIAVNQSSHVALRSALGLICLDIERLLGALYGWVVGSNVLRYQCCKFVVGDVVRVSVR